MSETVEEKPLNLQQRKLAVAKAVPYVQKDATVEAGGNRSYKGVSHDAVIAALRGKMIEFGIAMKVTQTESVCEAGETKGGAWKLRYRGWYDITLINADDPTETETGRIEAHADDSGDKAPGKGISYAVKMYLLKTFYLETGENDESRYQPDDPIVDKEKEAKKKATKAEQNRIYNLARNKGWDDNQLKKMFIEVFKLESFADIKKGDLEPLEEIIENGPQGARDQTAGGPDDIAI